jgi:steroid 5-alpha reductase family enzyme
MSWLTLFTVSFAIVWAYMTLIWLISLAKKDSSIVDIFWGLGFVILALTYFFLAPGFAPRKTLVTALVVIWGLRLSIRIFRRNWGRGEDFRYKAWREEAGGKYWWYSYLQVFLLQGLIMWLIVTPVLTAEFNATPDSITFFDLLGTVVWAIGFFFEAVGDWQLDHFKSDPANKGKLMRTGLWAYTRHPNYFGDALVWWGCGLIALGTPNGWWTLTGPLLMTYLLVKVSGVAMLEKTMKETKPGYKDYVESTNAFFPWFPH